MINLNKNTVAIFQSQRDQTIAKERHCRRNEIILTKFYKKFEHIVNLQIIMEEERT